MTDTTLSSSLEDYLEAIYHIVREKRAARPKDIAARLKVGASSVTGALKALAARDLVNYAPYDLVTLTPEGETLALDVVERHDTLESFFVKVLALDPKVAAEAACHMEHAVPPELIDRLVRFVEFVEMCPRGGPGLLEGFRVHLEAGCRGTCLEECPVSASGGPGLPVRVVGPTLADMPPRSTVRVVRVGGDAALRRRLVDLGLTAGVEVGVVRSAPLGDPLEIMVKGTRLSLRRREASHVEVDELG